MTGFLLSRLFHSLVPRLQRGVGKCGRNFFNISCANPLAIGQACRLHTVRRGRRFGHGVVAQLDSKQRGRTEGAKTNLLNRSKQRKPRNVPHDALPAGASLLPLLPPFPPVQPAFLSVSVWVGDSFMAERNCVMLMPEQTNHKSPITFHAPSPGVVFLRRFKLNLLLYRLNLLLSRSPPTDEITKENV